MFFVETKSTIETFVGGKGRAHVVEEHGNVH